MSNIKIVVATHKEYEMPEDEIYLPLFVGANKNIVKNIQNKDNVGDNISDKNPFFCELTGLYWAWKNLSADYIGLVHYRRRFKGKNEDLSKVECEKMLKNSSILLPKKRNYVIETLYSHYAHTMYIEPLDETGKIISEKYPKYLDEFLRLKTRRSAHMFNMMVMDRENFDNYCEWLFDILFELEKRIDNKKYDDFHARFYGRVSELLLDVWINTNNKSYKEIPFFSTEKVNWPKKIMSFLLAKFKGVKYDESF